MTPAQQKALQSVKDGRVEREYRAKGNVFKPPLDVEPRVLWSLVKEGLIRDGATISSGLVIRCKVILTKAGEAALLPGKP